MNEHPIHPSSGVTKFLDDLNHPLRNEIELLRSLILTADSRLSELIKWNAPSYCFDGNDRITMKIHPPKQVQLVFHCGAKVQEQPGHKLIEDAAGLLTWKGNNRAIATFKSRTEIEKNGMIITKMVQDWVIAAG